MENLKQVTMNDQELREGRFFIGLHNGHSFLSKTVFFFNSGNRKHFRFYCEGHGERRIEVDSIQYIFPITD